MTTADTDIIASNNPAVVEIIERLKHGSWLARTNFSDTPATDEAEAARLDVVGQAGHGFSEEYITADIKAGARAWSALRDALADARALRAHREVEGVLPPNAIPGDSVTVQALTALDAAERAAAEARQDVFALDCAMQEAERWFAVADVAYARRLAAGRIVLQRLRVARVQARIAEMRQEMHRLREALTSPTDVHALVAEYEDHAGSTLRAAPSVEWPASRITEPSTKD